MRDNQKHEKKELRGSAGTIEGKEKTERKEEENH